MSMSRVILSEVRSSLSTLAVPVTFLKPPLMLTCGFAPMNLMVVVLAGKQKSAPEDEREKVRTNAKMKYLQTMHGGSVEKGKNNGARQIRVASAVFRRPVPIMLIRSKNMKCERGPGNLAGASDDADVKPQDPPGWASAANLRVFGFARRRSMWHQ